MAQIVYNHVPGVKMSKFLSVFLRRIFRAFILAVVLTLLLPSQAFSWGINQPALQVLGQINLASSGYGTPNSFWPDGVAVDPVSGKLFVVDNLSNRVLRFSKEASLSNTPEAEAVLGQADFSNQSYSAAQNRMTGPLMMAVDSSGRLWVADSVNNRVLRFDDASNKASGANADGVLGQPNFTSAAYAASRNGMEEPCAVAVAGDTLWVADCYNNRVLRFEHAASKPNGADADGVLGQPDFTSNAAAATPNGMNYVRGITVDGTRLWVADSSNHRVLRFENAASKGNGANADGVLGQPDFVSKTSGLSQAKLYYPRGLYAEGGRLWVADYNNGRVLRFENAAGKPDGANADGVLGQPDFNSDAYTLTQSAMSSPMSVTGDGSGRIWVADGGNYRVLRFDAAALKNNGDPADGLLGQLDYTSALMSLTDSMHIKYPNALAIDPVSGKLFVADTFHYRVLRFANPRSLVNGAPAEAVLGQPDFAHAAPAVSQTGMSMPWGLAVDSSGRLWVADRLNNRVLRFNNAADKASGAPADGVLGQTDFITNTSDATQAKFDNPCGLATGSDGRLWVMDSGNNRVLRFDNAAGKANGDNADGVLGHSNFTSNSRFSTAYGMSSPVAGALDASGRLWVSDTGNSRVLRFDNAADKANGAVADGVLGQANFTSDESPTAAANRLYLPHGLALDSAGRLWVADTSHNRVVYFDQAAGRPNGADADGVLGQPDFTTATKRLVGADTLYSPAGIVLEGDKRVWVADFYHRVLLFRGPQASLSLAGEAATRAQTVQFTVVFETPVRNVSASNFSLVSSGALSGASIIGVSPNYSGSAQDSWTVTADTGSGEGTLALAMVNSENIVDIYDNGLDALPANSPNYAIHKAPPTAALLSAPNVTRPGGIEYLLRVRYEDPVSVAVGSLTKDNLTVSGPRGLKLTVNSVEASPSINSKTIEATYHLSPPGGKWDLTEHGVYTISLAGTQVSNVLGDTTPASTLGSFEVQFFTFYVPLMEK
jgi:sugar lactone lactonase YvrE